MLPNEVEIARQAVSVGLSDLHLFFGKHLLHNLKLYPLFQFPDFQSNSSSVW